MVGPAKERRVESSTLGELPSTDLGLDLPEGVPLNEREQDDGDSDYNSEQDGASALSSVFTLCNSCIGAGVLSLPFAFMKAGTSRLQSALTLAKAWVAWAAYFV